MYIMFAVFHATATMIWWNKNIHNKTLQGHAAEDDSNVIKISTSKVNVKMAYYWPISDQMRLAIHHSDYPTYIISRLIYDNVNTYPSIKKLFSSTA